MRILDKNTDFYDYFQNIYRDDTITFDRTDSFLLTKEDMCDYLYIPLGRREIYKGWYDFLLLQVCNRFWLFAVKVTKVDDYARPVDYKIQYIDSWTDYSKARELIKLEIISFAWGMYRLLYKNEGHQWRWRGRDFDSDIDNIFKYVLVLEEAIHNNDYEVRRHINCKRWQREDRTEIEKHIPILTACGLANQIDALQIYLAFEEYFSLEKQATERTTSIGITDKEKIENHGFDTKTSFRGSKK